MDVWKRVGWVCERGEKEWRQDEGGAERIKRLEVKTTNYEYSMIKPTG